MRSSAPNSALHWPPALLRFWMKLKDHVMAGARFSQETHGCARKQGVSTETLINVWLTEKVTETSQGT